MIFMFILLIFVGNAHAYQLGISPVEMKFIGKVNEEICNNVYIFSKDYKGEIIVYDTSDNEDFEINYKKKFNLNLKGKVEVCVKSGKKVDSLGYLMFKAVDGGIEIGNKIFIDIGNDSEEASLLTGRAISEFDNLNDRNNFGISLSVLFLETELFLLLVFLLLIVMYKKKTQRITEK